MHAAICTPCQGFLLSLCLTLLERWVAFFPSLWERMDGISNRKDVSGASGPFLRISRRYMQRRDFDSCHVMPCCVVSTSSDDQVIAGRKRKRKRKMNMIARATRANL